MNLYHYTDVNAVKSILERKKLWLTDVRFLNDAEEMSEGFKIIIRYLEYQVKKFPDRHEQFYGAVEYIKGSILLREGYGLDRRPVFVSSFSQSKDLLSQWRAYGAYAIEFDAELLPFPLSKCLYDDDEKSDEAAYGSLDCALTMAQSMQENDGQLDEKGYEAFSTIIGLAATMKHASFSEECEYRIVLGHDIDPDVEDALDISFRSRGNLLVPYVEVSIPVESIKSIMVGPMRDQDLAYASMKAFVNKVNAASFDQEIFSLHDIDIVKSSIPYRAP
ncbi:DUF2971 domain-containing protein [Pseudomonas aylmerensis]|uniref:DUF2971 domain-containing protein n=1 Tax=Pseudomonas aylmerensis TaxID=1869229 RepID=A0A2T4G1G8_9PSED|nr:DUF2971 domain-containing protein [Pseudomonas aylmerensis]OCW20987.1 hypothetical protein BBG20_25490 [Pseudomonas aylmerensis]PTC29530.1 DUF2971 domain-containing protein [Pseudomonas aylmerensis]